VAQEAGFFDIQPIPPDGRIWVAGCGTNQAVLTALRFPGAQVLGTDISTRSLEVSAQIALEIGLTNLRLEEASLNTLQHRAAFDHVICTGVIHHNANPEIPLATLAQALKPGGVMEMMVYNIYHRTQTTAYQKAIRLLSGATGQGGLIETELAMTAELVADFDLPGSMAAFLARQRDLPEPAVADSLLQPVEFSYTVQTLADMVGRAGLTLWQPCVNQFDRLSGSFNWDLPLPPGKALHAFNALPDLQRWQAANLLMLERAPMLWFYLGHGPARSSRAMVNQSFLDTTFTRLQSPLRNHVLGPDGQYSLSPRVAQLPAPALPADPAARAVFEKIDGERQMHTILAEAGLPQDQATLTRLRVLLTTPAFPYLVAS
jgi:SAM-dependent methyltransferase